MRSKTLNIDLLTSVTIKAEYLSGNFKGVFWNIMALIIIESFKNDFVYVITSVSTAILPFPEFEKVF